VCVFEVMQTFIRCAGYKLVLTYQLVLIFL